MSLTFTQVCSVMASPCSRIDPPANHVFEQRLLCMQSILCLVPDDALRTVDYFRGDFLAAMRGQAMHEERIRLRLPHHLRVDHPPGEIALALVVLLFEAHAGPHVGRDEIRATARRMRVGEGPDAASPIRIGALELELVSRR